MLGKLNRPQFNNHQRNENVNGHVRGHRHDHVHHPCFSQTVPQTGGSSCAHSLPLQHEDRQNCSE